MGVTGAPVPVVACLLVLVISGVCVPNEAATHLEAQESGVWHCTMLVATQDIPELRAKTSIPSFHLHVLLRYTSLSPNVRKNSVRIQGMNVADVMELPNAPPPSENGGSLKFRPFDPPAFEFNPELLLRPMAAPQNHSGFKLYTTLSFPLGPVISGLPMYIEATFNIPADWGHEYVLTALGGGEGKTCDFRPTATQNRLEPRGINIDLEPLRADNKQIPTEAVVIIKPLFNMRADLSAALIDRHLQHYAMIGFTRYIVYVLPRDLEALVAEPRIIKWVKQGMLSLIKWDAVPEHPGKVLWDQRVVYTHAVLAFLGRPTFLLMSDLDEYMASLKPGPASTVYDMVRECTQPSDNMVNLQLTRFHVIAKDWPNRTLSEQPLWMPDTREGHPVLRNSLINFKYPPYYKTMVNPNFIKVFFVHVASSFRQYNVTRPDPHCMILAHSCNVNYGRENLPERVSERFAEDPVWVAALDRLSRQRQQWLSTASPAAAMTGP